ncbi:MAG: hypothetical protein QG608_538 [Actinomycetota bacterium]|nr:hypothetical protein [Actinomycetota bacterium]
MTRRVLPPEVPATWLRVYEPETAFPRSRWERWGTLLEGGDTPKQVNARADRAQLLTSWSGLLGRLPSTLVSDDPVRMLRREGTLLACPVLDPGPPGPEAATPSPADSPILSAEADPEESGESGESGVARLEAGAQSPSGGNVEGRRRCLVKAWDLPIAWMVMVDPEERAKDCPVGQHLIPMGGARARVARGLRTLRRVLGDSETTMEIAILGRWLEEFHPQGWLEIDGTKVARLVGGEDGVDDVGWGLECLESGDSTGAAAAYQRIRRRSRMLVSLSRAS